MPFGGGGGALENDVFSKLYENSPRMYR